MFENFRYLPILGVRPAELMALTRLPNPDKDALLPIVCLKKWYSSGSLTKSMAQIERAFDQRQIILDLGPLGNGTGADLEMAALRNADNAFESWRAYLQDKATCIPTLQTNGADPDSLQRQAALLLELGRGLVVRLPCVRESEAIIASLGGLDCAAQHILVIIDAGQLAPRADIPLIAVTATALVEAAVQSLGAAVLSFAVCASSWPMEFASIDRVTARIDIRERQLHSVVAQSIARAGLGHAVIYGDYASVFAGQRRQSRPTDAQRVDYPTRSRWLFHRREQADGFVSAAQAIIADEDWEPELELWGAERIRRAAEGELDGLIYQKDWTAVRINLHMHAQLHFDAGRDEFLGTDEPWRD